MRVHAILSLGLALGLVTAATAASAQTQTWHIQTVDALTAGSFSSLRIDKYGNGHVAYVDEPLHQLKYAFWDHNTDKWFVAVLDASAGFCSLALDSQQRPHISYQDFGSARIKYAYWDGSVWHKQPVQIQAKDISFYTSLALDSNDNPRIGFYEYWGTGEDYLLHLRVVAFNGRFWEVQTVDTTPGSGKFNSIAVDSQNNTVIAYANVKAENQSLRYARWNGHGWTVNVLEGGNGPYPIFSVALRLDAHDRPHIAYTDVTMRVVKYATQQEDGKWHLETVDTLAESGYPDRHGIALDDEGNPYISYYDLGRGVLKLAHRTGGKWFSEIVDSNQSGFTSSLQIVNGRAYLTYRDDVNRRLKFAWRRIDDNKMLSSATEPRVQQ